MAGCTGDTVSFFCSLQQSGGAIYPPGSPANQSAVSLYQQHSNNGGLYPLQHCSDSTITGSSCLDTGAAEATVTRPDAPSGVSCIDSTETSSGDTTDEAEKCDGDSTNFAHSIACIEEFEAQQQQQLDGGAVDLVYSIDRQPQQQHTQLQPYTQVSWNSIQ